MSVLVGGLLSIEITFVFGYFVEKFVESESLFIVLSVTVNACSLQNGVLVSLCLNLTSHILDNSHIL